jgi:hypothetical protein
MDLQNYPRSRKSKRIQQPEALDTKTCSTFPVMACSSFVPVSMSDGQVLPLQLLNYFFCVEEFNYKAGPTHCDGRQWASGRGTGTGTARLRATCILNAASGWHQLNPADWGRQGRAIVRFQSRSGRCQWTSWPEAGAERDLRRRSDVKSQIHRQERAQSSYKHNHFHVPYPVFGVCTLAVQWECMRTVCRSSRVRSLFASFLNLDQQRYELVCTGMYWYVPVWTSMYRYIHVCTGMCQYVLVYTCRLQYIPVWKSTHIHLLVCSSMYCYELVWTSTYWYIPAFTLISYTLMPSFPVTRHITVQGSTMKYPKVLYTWITTVQQGRRQYKALYLDVPPYTVVIQVYRTFGYSVPQ